MYCTAIKNTSSLQLFWTAETFCSCMQCFFATCMKGFVCPPKSKSFCVATSVIHDNLETLQGGADGSADQVRAKKLLYVTKRGKKQQFLSMSSFSFPFHWLRKYFACTLKDSQLDLVRILPNGGVVYQELAYLSPGETVFVFGKSPVMKMLLRMSWEVHTMSRLTCNCGNLLPLHQTYNVCIPQDSSICADSSVCRKRCCGRLSVVSYAA